MNRIFAALLAAALALGLTACSSSQEDLVSKTPFPEFSDATIVNFWNNGCGTCIEEMPELEELYQQFKEENINLIGVASDSGQSEEQLETAQNILSEKGVTYLNLSPDPENELYKDFIAQLAGYPTTYIVDRDGNIIGAPIIGNVKDQEDTLERRLEQAVAEE